MFLLDVFSQFEIKLFCCVAMRFKPHISVLVIYFEEFEMLQVLAFIYHPSNIAKIPLYRQKPSVILRFNKQRHELDKSLGTPAAINICLNMLGIIRQYHSLVNLKCEPGLQSKASIRTAM